jgi:hypothetical protein
VKIGVGALPGALLPDSELMEVIDWR